MGFDGADGYIMEISDLKIELLHSHKNEERLTKENAELRQQLEASQKLSEERRVALVRCYPYSIHEDCQFCGAFEGSIVKHKPDCDYIRLIKEGE